MVEGLLIALLVAVTVSASPQWLSTSSTIREGGIHLLSCRLQGPSHSIVVDHVRQALTTPFFFAGHVSLGVRKRVFAKVTPEAENFHNVKIVIVAVREEDSGEYVCYSSSEPQLKQSTTLNVLTPISVMTFRNLGTFSHVRKPLQLRQGHRSGVECSATVYGSRRSPAMGITTDLGQDVTHLFSLKSQVVEKTNDHDIPMLKSVSKLTYETTSPDLSLHNRRLVCSAKLLDSAAIASTLFVEFEPSITCDRYIRKAQLGGDVAFRCTVTSQPPSFVTWTPVRRSRDARETADDTNITLVPQTIDEFKSSHRFNITNLRPYQFSQYVIRATNDFATNQVILKIEEEKKEMKIGGKEEKK